MGITRSQYNRAVILFDDMVDAIAKSIKKEIWDNAILLSIDNWMNSMSSIEMLETRIQKAVESKKNKIETIIRPTVRRYIVDLESIIGEHSNNIIEQALVGFNGEVEDFESDNSFTDDITFIVQSITIVVASVVSGGAGTAIIATGPIGLIIGAIIGIFAARSGKETISSYVKMTPLPPMIKKLSKSKVFSSLSSKENEFESEITESIRERLGNFTSYLEKQIEK